MSPETCLGIKASHTGIPLFSAAVWVVQRYLRATWKVNTTRLQVVVATIGAPCRSLVLRFSALGSRALCVYARSTRIF